MKFIFSLLSFIGIVICLLALSVQSFQVGYHAPTRRSYCLYMNKETIVVTGLGVISSVGVKPDIFFNNLLNGMSGISKVDRFDANPFKCQIAGQVNNFDPKSYYQSKKKIKQNDLSCHYAVAASHEALADASLKLDSTSSVDATRVGVIIGSAFGGMDSFEKATNDLNKYGPNSVGPYTIPMILGNTAAGIVAMETGAKGPNFGVQTACATATHAFGEVSQSILFLFMI
jgi:3-oxoacyl-[acyl-carrier-protein] synthase II